MPTNRRKVNRGSGPRKRTRRAQFRQAPRVNPNSLVYTGPIISAADRQEADTDETMLMFTGDISSSAGGTIDSNYSNDPNSYSLNDWTNLIALWHEYRVLGFTVKFFPNNRYSKTTTVTAPLIVCVDRQTSGTLSTYQGAMNHSSAMVKSIEDPWTMTAKMQNAEEAQFKSTASTSANTWIKFFATGLSVSTSYGRSFVYLRIQFRGRK